MLKATYDVNNNGIVDNAEKVNNHTVEKDVPANAVFTDTTYSEATTSQSGLMSSTDKSNLDSNTEARHTHSNKSVLDGIDSTDITNWNNKVDNTDYASSSNAGLIRIGTATSTYLSSDNRLSATTRTYEDYESGSAAMFVGKGTLENVIEGKGLATKSDIPKVFYGTSATGATTSAKVVVCEEFTEADLVAGTRITVLFTNANTYNGQATLNINGTGAKNIYYNGTTTNARYMWVAGESVDFIYNGTQWATINGGLASTSYYGVTKLATSAGSDSQAYALTPRGLFYFANYSIAPYYSASSTYAVGDKVRYTYYIYECITAIETPEAWTAEHWQQIDTVQEQIDDKEDKSNKVTSISSTSTDTQYPSAKCVYDYIDNKVAIFNWDGQSSQDNSDNITLFQEIYDTQLERPCIIIANSSMALDVPAYVFNVPKNYLNSSDAGAYIHSAMYYDSQRVSNGITTDTTRSGAVAVVFTNGEISQVSDILQMNYTTKYLDPTYNYTNLYQPLYDGSPATKKYVDDRVSKSILWENSSPTSAFTAKTITLSSSDYDYIMLYYARTPASRNEVFCNILEKNKDTELLYSDFFNSTSRAWSRSAVIRNGTSVTFGECLINGGANNSGLVPQKIIGCKY